jgi:hypothetical protein
MLNLFKIFHYLTDDPYFLTILVHSDNPDVHASPGKQREHVQKIGQSGHKDMLSRMVVEYAPLAPHERQNYLQFPKLFQKILTPKYYRQGIIGTVERDGRTVNLSFLASLNFILRPETRNMDQSEFIRHLLLLENFVFHKIERNHQIDRVKNTKRVQAANRQMITALYQGHYTDESILRILNIFEVNLLVFSLSKMQIRFYWSSGTHYPYINFFNKVLVMMHVHDCYEPVTGPMDMSTVCHIYARIIRYMDRIQFIPDPKISVFSLLWLQKWLPDGDYLQLLGRFFGPAPSLKGLIKKYQL